MGDSDDSSVDDRDVFAARKRRRFLNATGGKRSSPRAAPATSTMASDSEDSGDDFLNGSGLSPEKANASRILRSRNSQLTDQESDSGTETPDSDEMPVLDRSKKKTKIAKKPAPKPPPVQKLSQAQKVAKRNTIPSTPQSSQKSQTKKVLSPVKDKELFNQLVNKCVFYLLVADQKKYLIRKQAIIEHVFKDHNYNATLFKEVIVAAGNNLKKTFGFELLSDKDQKDAYMLVNILKPELEVHEMSQYSRLKTQQRGLLLFLLTVIFMNENVIPEDELWVALKPMGIDATSRKPHPVFGDVKKLISGELVRQMYLESRSISKDPPQVEYSWGKRALQEVDKRDILEFACKVMKDTVPEDWILQYKDAQEAAGENQEED
ncbi:non-structural maintenance of chromosomes element 3 homolog isoform X2 [Uloborus diversus]|uniref:non-structural maintenance of chromosomes element 3 homolog isoform X2 n=1 Tax=Uloborus diversus TaxID=327109 RepID=UPI002409B771|nr:non-structural maintenance of chromosomes element 3 homolog isoform X2 [Uloborus diversus]